MTDDLDSNDTKSDGTADEDRVGPWMDLRGRTISADGEPYGHSGSLVGSDLRGARIRSLASIDLTFATLAGADLRRAHTEWIFAAKANFRGADFSGATLWQPRFFRCDFSGAVFDRTRMAGVVAIECDFTGATFDRTSFEGADPTGANHEAIFFSKRFGLTGSANRNADGSDAPDDFAVLDGCVFTASKGLPSAAWTGSPDEDGSTSVTYLGG